MEVWSNQVLPDPTIPLRGLEMVLTWHQNVMLEPDLSGGALKCRVLSPCTLLNR